MSDEAEITQTNGAELSALHEQTCSVIYGEQLKLKNRRVGIGRKSNGLYIVQYRKLLGWKNVKVTQFELTEEAADATMFMLARAKKRTEHKLSQNERAEKSAHPKTKDNQ